MNKYIHRLILLTPIFMIALYGCARYEPPSEFVAPTYNPKTIPNPPIYPNKRLSSDAVKIPDKVIDFKEVQPFTKLYKIVWYEPTNIGFIGQPGRVGIAVYAHRKLLENTNQKQITL